MREGNAKICAALNKAMSTEAKAKIEWDRSRCHPFAFLRVRWVRYPQLLVLSQG